MVPSLRRTSFSWWRCAPAAHTIARFARGMLVSRVAITGEGMSHILDFLDSIQKAAQSIRYYPDDQLEIYRDSLRYIDDVLWDILEGLEEQNE